MAGHENFVFFWVSVAGMRQPVGQLAIVGEQNQAFAVHIQPPNRV
jgi:hypothetical protein